MVTNVAILSDPDDQVFTALADPTRRRVLILLKRQPSAVHELSDMFSISRPAISKHLRVLRDASLVRVEKRGTENVYVLETERLRLAETWLRQFWTTHLNDLKTLAEGTWHDADT